MTLWGVVAGVLAYAAGIAVGRSATEASLILGPTAGGVCGPHKLGGKFYYLVPERLWVDVLIYQAKARHQPHAGGDEEEEGG